MANVIVYIDGFNLYYGALKRTPYKWLDLGRLCSTMLPADNLLAINYYTARISARPGNPGAPTDQQIYLRALRTIPNLSITYGHFLTHSVRMALTGVTPTQRVWVDKTEEKGSDVNLAAHLVRDACHKRFDVAVLITNDSDLAEPVRIVRQELGFGVGILNPHQHHSAEPQEGSELPEAHPTVPSGGEPIPSHSDGRKRQLSQAHVMVNAAAIFVRARLGSTRAVRTAHDVCFVRMRSRRRRHARSSGR